MTNDEEYIANLHSELGTKYKQVLSNALQALLNHDYELLDAMIEAYNQATDGEGAVENLLQY